MQNLYDWQENCLDCWFQNNCRGIAHVVTGAGKTILALGAAARLDADEARRSGRKLLVKILVPKIFLAHQWAADLQSELHVSRLDVGYYYGNHKKDVGKKYMIYVINSARYALARHVLDDISRGDCVLLIADECHHYGSAENVRVFDFLPFLPVGGEHYFALGLSATPAVPAGAAPLEPFLGPEIYRYDFAEALEADIISDFSVFRVGVDFFSDEAEEYDVLTERLNINMTRLKGLYPALRRLAEDAFFAKLQMLAGDQSPKVARLAQTVLALFWRRRELVYLAENRVSCVKMLIACLPETARIIVFGERIECADALFHALRKQYPGQVGRYHSEMGPPAKKTALEQYQSGEIRILVSCKALDEGFNVPQTDVGIILSGTATARQSIQRLGRILRRRADGRSARLYMVYVNRAQEEDALGLSTKHVHTLTYNRARDGFVYPEYEALCQRTYTALCKRGAAPSLLTEAEKNMRLGVVRGDFRLSVEVCRKNIQAARSKREKNYWITMLFLIETEILARE